MTSLKNKWRKRGRLEFRRETKRFSDGSPWLPRCDVLYVRIRRTACCTVEPFDWKTISRDSLCVHAGTYRSASPISAARMVRATLLRALEERR